MIGRVGGGEGQLLFGRGGNQKDRLVDPVPLVAGTADPGGEGHRVSALGLVDAGLDGIAVGQRIVRVGTESIHIVYGRNSDAGV